MEGSCDGVKGSMEIGKDIRKNNKNNVFSKPLVNVKKSVFTRGFLSFIETILTLWSVYHPEVMSQTTKLTTRERYLRKVLRKDTNLTPETSVLERIRVTGPILSLPSRLPIDIFKDYCSKNNITEEICSSYHFGPTSHFSLLLLSKTHKWYTVHPLGGLLPSFTLDSTRGRQSTDHVRCRIDVWVRWPDLRHTKCSTRLWKKG